MAWPGKRSKKDKHGMYRHTKYSDKQRAAYWKKKYLAEVRAHRQTRMGG